MVSMSLRISMAVAWEESGEAVVVVVVVVDMEQPECISGRRRMNTKGKKKVGWPGVWCVACISNVLKHGCSYWCLVFCVLSKGGVDG